MLREVCPTLPESVVDFIYRKFDKSQIDRLAMYDPFELPKFTNEEITPLDIRNFCLYDFEQRIKQMETVILYLMEKANKEGKAVVSMQTINKKMLLYLKKVKHPLLYHDSVYPFIYNLIYKHKLVLLDEKNVSLTYVYNNELKIYNEINYRRKIKNSHYENLELIEGSPLVEEQAKIIPLIRNEDNFNLLTGGAGTGKTTVVGELIKSIKAQFPKDKLALVAPTGKAVKRIKEEGFDFDIEIKTIHSFAFKQKKMPYDFVVVDEVSMLDFSTALMLFNAVQPNCKFLFVGDNNQLPAIGSGDIIKTLTTKKINHLHLSENHRSNSSVITNSYLINDGRVDLKIDENFQIKEDIKAEDIKDIDLGDNDMLLSAYKNPCFDSSTYYLNQHIQEKVQGEVRNEFNLGDKVIFLKNNYRAGYYNGDKGVITNIDRDGYHVKLDVPNNDKEYVYCTEEKEIELAYAITVHKSQGSEAEVVYIYIPEYSDFLTRRTLYTAVTRAKRKVVLLTKREILEKIINNNADNRECIADYYKQLAKKPTVLAAG